MDEGEKAMAKNESVTGACECGSVTYSARSAGDVTLCFCKQCQRQTSYAVAASHVPLDGFSLRDPDQSLTWYDSSDNAKRGFCTRCGSALFWQMFQADGSPARDYISVMAGTLDETSDLLLKDQIYVDGAQAYHHVDDAVSALTEAEVNSL